MATVNEKMTALADAIRAKTGGTTPLSIDGMTAAIASIGNAGGIVGNGKFRVRFFDYDGTILKTVYTDGGEVEAPEVPDHERLVFQEWNNDFDNITGDLDVGAIYTTKSGKCEFVLEKNSLTGLKQYIGLSLVSGTITVEWGDGSTETLSTAGDTRISHTYASSGKYILLVSGTAQWRFMAYSLTKDENNTSLNDISVTAMHLCKLNYNQVQEGLAGLNACKEITIDRDSVYIGAMFFGHTGVCHFNFTRNLPPNNARFSSCNYLQRVVFAQGTTVIENACFSNGGMGQDIVIPDTVTTIKNSAFQLNGVRRYMREVTIPPLVTDIEQNAFNTFNTRTGLKKLIMKPNTPPTIQFGLGYNVNSTFPSTGSLKEIIVPKGCGEAYKSATNWSYYADIIKEEE